MRYQYLFRTMRDVYCRYVDLDDNDAAREHLFKVAHEVENCPWIEANHDASNTTSVVLTEAIIGISYMPAPLPQHSDLSAKGHKI